MKLVRPSVSKYGWEINDPNYHPDETVYGWRKIVLPRKKFYLRTQWTGWFRDESLFVYFRLCRFGLKFTRGRFHRQAAIEMRDTELIIGWFSLGWLEFFD